MRDGEIWWKRDTLNRSATNIFSTYITPVYLIDYRNIPIQFGSAFLINFRNENYLITAAHSLMPEKGSDYERHLPCISVGKKNEKFLIKDFAYSLTESDKENEYDIAAVRLDQNVINQMFLSDGRNMNVLPFDKVMPNLPRERNLFCAAGYQNSKNKPHPTGQFLKPKSSAYLGGSPTQDVYESLLISPKTHLLVDFPTESDREGRMPGAPIGLSGGPVFAFGVKDSWDNIEYGLAGVITRYIPAKMLFKATDIGMILKLIARYDYESNKGHYGILLE